MTGMSRILYMTPIVNLKGLADGIRKYSRKPGYPARIFRKNLQSKRKKLKDMQNLNALPHDAREQLRLYIIEMDYKIAKYKAMIYFNY